MSLKLILICSLATVSVAGLSTGGYFLFTGSKKEEYKPEPGNGDIGSNGQPGVGTPAAAAAKAAATAQPPPPSTPSRESADK